MILALTKTNNCHYLLSMKLYLEIICLMYTRILIGFILYRSSDYHNYYDFMIVMAMSYAEDNISQHSSTSSDSYIISTSFPWCIITMVIIGLICWEPSLSSSAFWHGMVPLISVIYCYKMIFWQYQEQPKNKAKHKYLESNLASK